MKFVNQPIRKKDGMALVTGKPVYTSGICTKRLFGCESVAKPTRTCDYQRNQN